VVKFWTVLNLLVTRDSYCLYFEVSVLQIIDLIKVGKINLMTFKHFWCWICVSSYSTQLLYT